MKTKFITPLLTILREDGTIDQEGNARQIRRMADAGVDAVAVLGTTGEFCHLHMQQKKELISIAKDAAEKDVSIMVGAGAMTAEESLELIRYAETKDIHDILLVSPYYFSMSQESLYFYYDMVASATDSRIYIYNYPERTGNDISDTLTHDLVETHPNIVGYKDTVTNAAHTARLIQRMADFPDFEIYTGFENNYLPVAFAGGAGCIGGLSNLEATVFVGMRDALDREDVSEIARLQKKINLYMQVHEVGASFISAVKRALKIMGIIESDRCAPPLCTLSDKQEIQLKEVLKELQLI